MSYSSCIFIFSFGIYYTSTPDEGKGRLNPSRDKSQGKHRRSKVGEKSCVTFILCDPGWYVHKSDVQNKWDDNTQKHTLLAANAKRKIEECLGTPIDSAKCNSKLKYRLGTSRAIQNCTVVARVV